MKTQTTEEFMDEVLNQTRDYLDQFKKEYRGVGRKYLSDMQLDRIMQVVADQTTIARCRRN